MPSKKVVYTAPVNNTRILKMATVDLSKLSYAELVKQQKALEELIAAKRDEELVAFVKKTVEGAEAIGLPLEELIKALQARAPKNGPVGRTRRLAAAKKVGKVMPERGATYKHPDTGETYKRSELGKGRVVKWLQDLVDAGGTFEKYKV